MTDRHPGRPGGGFVVLPDYSVTVWRTDAAHAEMLASLGVSYERQAAAVAGVRHA